MSGYATAVCPHKPRARRPPVFIVDRLKRRKWLEPYSRKNDRTDGASMWDMIDERTIGTCVRTRDAATGVCERTSPKRARINFELAGVPSVPTRMGAMPCQTQQPGSLGQPLAALFS